MLARLGNLASGITKPASESSGEPVKWIFALLSTQRIGDTVDYDYKAVGRALQETSLQLHRLRRPPEQIIDLETTPMKRDSRRPAATTRIGNRLVYGHCRCCWG